jgi:hypothetical protein
MSRIQDFVQVIEAWLPFPNDTVQLEEWNKTADYIAYTYEFSEYEQIYVDTLLDMYEEQFQEMFLHKTPIILPKEYLDELLGRTQIEQRTEAWYRQMSTIISASELGNLFASPYQRSKFVVTKSQPYQSRQQHTAVSSHHMTAFDWGIRFEPVVKQIYEYKYGTIIKDLGRLIHPTHPRCAASPDGLIYHCPEGKRQGHLIEIKCPVTREIDGSVPKDYYHQMQMQLHVTGLKFCEYVEASFASPYNSTHKEGPALYDGYIALIRRSELQEGQEFYYMYSPVNCGHWSPVIDAEEDLIEMIPWRLHQWSEHMIERSEEWWTMIHPMIDAFWCDVEKHKRGEFTVLESSRPAKKLKPTEKCMITFTRLDYGDAL